MRAHRLVTLTGVGGVGKTRLALQVAAELAGEFPDGVWLVELAAVGDPAAVPDAVAAVLGITAQAGSSVADSVAAGAGGRRVLLVLDNCEHVLDAAADLVEAILAPDGDREGRGHLAAKGCGSAPSSCGRSPRSTSRRGRLGGGRSCSSNGPGRSTPASSWPTPTMRRRWWRSAGASTASPWRSSWRRPGWCR